MQPIPFVAPESERAVHDVGGDEGRAPRRARVQLEYFQECGRFAAVRVQTVVKAAFEQTNADCLLE